MNYRTLLTAAALISNSLAMASTDSKPNIIYILADDLGYGDLSCMGQKRFSTPNIDRLAADGMLFTQHYAGSAVSAPSRSTLLTGQHTGYTPIRGNKAAANKQEGQHPIPKESFNVMKLLKQNGYTTGVFGKWGLGSQGSEGDPNKQGVDEFYGFNCQRLAHHYYPYHLWHNQEKVILKGNAGNKETEYTPYLIHDKAIDFIKENKKNPFFMYYASILPHAELLIPEKELKQFRGKLLPEKAYKGVDSGAKYRQGPYGSQKECHAAFAAMISLLDKQVGDIVSTLDKLGLAENTIIVFASDNGPHKEGGADPQYFDSNGDLRGTKRDLYEGGIRVPMIVKWTNIVKAGVKTDHISAFWDFMPTIADIIDADIPSPINGLSYLPTLLGDDTKQVDHSHLYWELHEQGGRIAIRKGDWKAVIYGVTKGGKLELYNLKNDLAEKHNVATENPELVKELMAILKESRSVSPVYTFSLPTYNADVE